MNHEYHKFRESAKREKYYTCPMHPDILQSKPGLCPECGMNLIKHEARSRKHGARAARNEVASSKHASGSMLHDSFFRKFWVSFILTIPTVLYSELPRELFGWEMPAFSGYRYLSLILASIVFFYGGWIFLASAWRELKAKLPGMMTLIALAISVAYLYSIGVFVEGTGHTLFWELTSLITVMLLGHLVEMKAVQGAQSALKELSKLLPDTAELILGTSDVPNISAEGGSASGGDVNFRTSDVQKLETEIIPLSELKEGDLVFVRPGGKIPADGIVIEGKSDANESMITGESAPVKKDVGKEVIAGTINGDGALKIKVTKIGENTFLAGVMRLVREAQASKSRLQILSDRAAFYLTIIAIGAGGLTFILWIMAKAGFGFALERLVAVLVIACPHALGLAIPLVASISTTMAARHGFLIRQRLSLESARKINVVLFDKTGTLTKGEYGITKTWAVSGADENEILKLAASVDSHSEHFISKAIVKKAQEKGISLLSVKDFSRIPGKGVKGLVNGKEIAVGGISLLDDFNVALPVNIKEEIKEANKKGETIIFAFRERELLGVFALADLIREESKEAVLELQAIGIRVAMVTGDSEDVARWVARALGIDEYFAKVLPQQKSEKVRLLQAKGYKVAMVGDGINDAPALVQADLGIAIGAGTNVAIESAGIILVKNDPRDIAKIIKLSKLTYAKMIQNLFWATGYNAVALPLAAGALAFKGILLQPALAAVFMSLSTVIVAVNAILLKRKKL